MSLQPVGGGPPSCQIARLSPDSQLRVSENCGISLGPGQLQWCDRCPLPCCRENSHYPDYQADTLFHGLSELVAGQNVVDVPKRQ